MLRNMNAAVAAWRKVAITVCIYYFCGKQRPIITAINAHK